MSDKVYHQIPVDLGRGQGVVRNNAGVRFSRIEHIQYTVDSVSGVLALGSHGRFQDSEQVIRPLPTKILNQGQPLAEHIRPVQRHLKWAKVEVLLGYAEGRILQGSPQDFLMAALDNRLLSQEDFLSDPNTLKPGAIEKRRECETFPHHGGEGDRMVCLPEAHHLGLYRRPHGAIPPIHRDHTIKSVNKV